MTDFSIMESFLGDRCVKWRRVTMEVRAVWLLLLFGSFTSQRWCFCVRVASKCCLDGMFFVVAPSLFLAGVSLLLHGEISWKLLILLVVKQGFSGRAGTY